MTLKPFRTRILVLSNSAADRFRRDLTQLPPALPGTKLGLAVSGGPDSTALSWLAQRVLDGVDLRVAIVDHGLRGESAAEAELVRDRLRSMGFDPEILTCVPPADLKSGNRAGKMEWARGARYHHLQKWASEHGILRIWLGHHADDQQETIVMRQQQGATGEGLRGMDPVRAESAVIFERPLLSWLKQDLVQLCEDQALPFVSDPTNADLGTQRGRLRAEGLVSSVPVKHAPQTSLTQTGAIVAHCLGHAWIKRDVLTAAELRSVCAWVRGGHYAPSRERTSRALLGLKMSERATLFGCVIEQRSENWILIAREARPQNPLRAKQMETGQWRVDDRWVVDRADGEWSFVGQDAIEGAADLVVRATAACLRWNGNLPRFEKERLIWPDNSAVFCPRRPLVWGFGHKKKAD